MNNQVAHYTIGPESVADYLQDIEKRWGVRLQFKMNYTYGRDGTPVLTVELHMEHVQHLREIPWYKTVKAIVTQSSRQTMEAKLWDMLYEADKQIERDGG